ncbi:hypothetical protein EV426DRAFT_621532 [Tirmania nivea]|nr:hypothetical protein EV426DRAFT_621532 [Tirmania nivea]
MLSCVHYVLCMFIAIVSWVLMSTTKVAATTTTTATTAVTPTTATTTTLTAEDPLQVAVDLQLRSEEEGLFEEAVNRQILEEMATADLRTSPSTKWVEIRRGSLYGDKSKADLSVEVDLCDRMRSVSLRGKTVKTVRWAPGWGNSPDSYSDTEPDE